MTFTHFLRERGAGEWITLYRIVVAFRLWDQESKMNRNAVQ